MPAAARLGDLRAFRFPGAESMSSMGCGPSSGRPQSLSRSPAPTGAACRPQPRKARREASKSPRNRDLSKPYEAKRSPRDFAVLASIAIPPRRSRDEGAPSARGWLRPLRSKLGRFSGAESMFSMGCGRNSGRMPIPIAASNGRTISPSPAWGEGTIESRRFGTSRHVLPRIIVICLRQRCWTSRGEQRVNNNWPGLARNCCSGESRISGNQVSVTVFM